MTRRLGTHWRSDCTPCWHAPSCAKCAPHSTRNLPRSPRTCSARDRSGRGPGAQHSPARAGLLCQSRERANGGPSSASMPWRQARESARDLAEHVPGTWALEAGCLPPRPGADPALPPSSQAACRPGSSPAQAHGSDSPGSRGTPEPKTGRSRTNRALRRDTYPRERAAHNAAQGPSLGFIRSFRERRLTHGVNAGLRDVAHSGWASPPWPPSTGSSSHCGQGALRPAAARCPAGWPPASRSATRDRRCGPPQAPPAGDGSIPACLS